MFFSFFKDTSYVPCPPKLTRASSTDHIATCYAIFPYLIGSSSRESQCNVAVAGFCRENVRHF